MSMLVCSCCCIGRAQALTYDRLFIVYTLLLFGSVGTYIWTCVLRTSFTSKVCSGDFLDHSVKHDETHSILIWDIEHAFYLISSAKLIDWFIAVESLFLFCCTSASTIWALSQKNPLSRFITSVEHTHAEQHRHILEDRLAFKRQMQAQDRLIYEMQFAQRQHTKTRSSEGSFS